MIAVLTISYTVSLIATALIKMQQIFNNYNDVIYRPVHRGGSTEPPIFVVSN